MPLENGSDLLMVVEKRVGFGSKECLLFLRCQGMVCKNDGLKVQRCRGFQLQWSSRYADCFLALPRFGTSVAALDKLPDGSSSSFRSTSEATSALMRARNGAGLAV